MQRISDYATSKTTMPTLVNPFHPQKLLKKFFMVKSINRLNDPPCKLLNVDPDVFVLSFLWSDKLLSINL